MQKFDVIVVGSGAAGGWACKRLSEAGLNVALVDCGKQQSDKNFGEHIPEFTWKYRNQAGNLMRSLYPVQSTNPGFNEFNKDWFCNDLLEPYTVADGTSFSWQARVRITGGRTNEWGRQSYRLSDLDFKAASHDGYGEDWPLSYKDVAPYYDIVESYVGIEIIEGEERGPGQSRKEGMRKMEGARGKGEGHVRVHMGQSRKNDPGHRRQHNAQQHHRHASDGCNGPVEQNGDDHADTGGDCGDGEVAEVLAAVEPLQQRHALHQRLHVIAEADAGRRHAQRAGEQHLPQKQKGKQAAPALALEGFAKIDIGAAGARHGSAQFGVDQSVAHGENRAQNPAQHRLRAAHVRNDRAQRDERPNADHVEHVGGGGLQQSHASHELAGRDVNRRRRWSCGLAHAVVQYGGVWTGTGEYSNHGRSGQPIFGQHWLRATRAEIVSGGGRGFKGRATCHGG